MKVMILCGGVGTRLREETEFRPKPLVDIGGRPILWHIMKIYAHYGYRVFVLCLGYRGQMIKEYFLNYEAMNSDVTLQLGGRKTAVYHQEHQEHDFRVTLADTGDQTMTGGRIKRAQPYVAGDDSFMVTYGDGVADVDLAKVVAFHRSHGKTATLTTVRAQSRYGVVDVAADGRVEQFREKPRLDEWVHVGFFVFNRRLFDHLSGDDCILEREPLERLAAAGELMAYRHEGFFHAMDTYREYQALNQMWSAGRAPWKVWA